MEGKTLLCMVMRLIFRHMVEVRMQSVCTQNLRKPNTEQEGLHTEEAALRSTQGDFFRLQTT